MKNLLILLLTILSISAFGQNNNKGYYDFTWDEENGKVLLDIKNLGEDFLYVNSLTAGIGSNDIGLDRGQLGGDRIVRFEKVGNKILLVQPNLRFRAESNNKMEVKSMEEAFAQSVIGGFKIEKTENGVHTIDLTPFLLRDAHGVASRLKRGKQGTYKMDAKRSAIYLENTISFPDNTEFEALITFSGEPTGSEIRSVTPDAKSVSVRMHHSFVRLPDNAYKKRAFHPFSGFNNINYYDYAAPIYESNQKRYIVRHRLEKKNPNAAMSEAVEPIIYYIDPGCPEPVKSALMEGAAWWNQAYESAGYKDAFQVKELPAGAHPLDVRYNMIQWVHRSTRGWSYGASVVDPRTGEIIKGHVSLGSLRVRQDFMIAQGIMAPYGKGDDNYGPMMDVALARLRQLAAHEVGHTIGLAHNFASSVNDRASVMDYPHPIIDVANGAVNYKDVYDTKIGNWDKRTILYGYQDFPAGTDESNVLKDMIHKSQSDGYLFISDQDARPPGGLNPDAHLWDNGKNPIAELERLNKVRSHALAHFGVDNITTGTPYSELEKVLVPVYLMNRYQIEAVSKLLGGSQYTYAVKGDKNSPKVVPVSTPLQDQALSTLLKTVSPEYLKIPQNILNIIPPSAFGYRRDRETFSGNTGLAFDPLGAAEASINNLFNFLMNDQRLSRINLQGQNNLHKYLDNISSTVFTMKGTDAMESQIVMLTQKLLAVHMINASIKSRNHQVAGMAKYVFQENLQKILDIDNIEDHNIIAHLTFLTDLVEKAEEDPAEWKLPSIKAMPPGSPIGCGGGL